MNIEEGRAAEALGRSIYQHTFTVAEEMGIEDFAVIATAMMAAMAHAIALLPDPEMRCRFIEQSNGTVAHFVAIFASWLHDKDDDE